MHVSHTLMEWVKQLLGQEGGHSYSDSDTQL